jgi:hypothetical protein
MSTSDSGIAGLQMEDGLSEFVTMEMLNEQLSVVEHYLETTPITPFTTSRRYKLTEEREQLLRLIETKILEGEDPNTGESNNSSSPTTSLSPTLSAQPDPSNTNSASISGFSTPDLFAGRDHNPFASAFEEPFLPDTNRMAQELAYIHFQI